ncbi:MAG TPA: enoyl-CoA hydratase-related protein [Candidatus Methylomirabilis sp.]|jgi:2-(1,2-epoxy-1,2-dihydrophenyl)acetyl-CoA isomerase
MSYQEILFRVEHRVAYVTLNRPQVLNALSIEMTQELLDAIDRVRRDPGPRCMVLAGAGRAFCAGGDVKAFREQAARGAAGALPYELAVVMHRAIAAMVRMPKPTIAAVQGFAAGGGVGLALGCDLVVAAEGARFDMAYARIGTSPDGASTYFLPRTLGVKRALELALFGGAIDAQEALGRGLINWVVPPGELEVAVRDWAERLARGPAHAMGIGKALMYRGLHEGLEAQMEAEAVGIGACGRTPDFVEGVTAFVEKRPPAFAASEP